MASIERIDNNNFVIKSPSNKIHSDEDDNQVFEDRDYIWGLKSSPHDKNERFFYLLCDGPDDDLWNIDASVTFDFKKGESKNKRTFNTCFNRSNPELKYSLGRKMKMGEFSEAYPNLEIRVKINSITGVERGLLNIDFEKEDDQLSDVALIVEGKKLYVNKAVLATHSPVFRAMFFSGFRESTEKEVTINDVKFADFKNFLQAIHSADHYIKERNIEKILILADRYDVGIVMKKCEKFLLSTIWVTNSEKLRLAETYTFPEVHRKCMISIDTKEKLASLCENTSKFGPMTLQAIIKKTKDLQK